jgi:hypothetical protein
MAKQPKTGHLVQRFRKERGVPIKVERHAITLPDGTEGAMAAIDLSQAEVPDRSYVADACGARYQNETVDLMFAQPKLGGGLRSLALISMTPLAAAQLLRSLEEMRAPGLASIAEQLHINEEPLLDFPTTEPDQTAVLVANIAAVAVSGRETCMDFYHANAFSYLQMNRTNNVTLEPVVRINTRTALLLSLVKKMKILSEQFPSDAKAI